MELQPDLQRLLQRHGEIQRAMRRPGGIRITVERELFAIREQLKNFPTALKSLQGPWTAPTVPPEFAHARSASSPPSARRGD